MADSDAWSSGLPGMREGISRSAKYSTCKSYLLLHKAVDEVVINRYESDV